MCITAVHSAAEWKLARCPPYLEKQFVSAAAQLLGDDSYQKKLPPYSTVAVDIVGRLHTETLLAVQVASFHVFVFPGKALKETQSSPPPALFGSPLFQYVHITGDASDHAQVPSCAESVKLIHPLLIGYPPPWIEFIVSMTAVNSATEWKLARCPPYLRRRSSLPLQLQPMS
jgi:hypothetical protein